MRIIIHIGQHKTGTTSIQYCLHENRNHHIKNGLYIPLKVGGKYDRSHYKLGIYGLSAKRFSHQKRKPIDKTKLKNALINEIEFHYNEAKALGCKNIIYSSEDLYLLNSEEEYRDIKNLFNNIPAQIDCICCFREKESYIKSYANTIKRWISPDTLKKDSVAYTQPDSWLLDYERKKELLTNTFDNAIFFDYNKEDNTTEFFKHIGYDVDEKWAKIRRNVTKEKNKIYK